MRFLSSGFTLVAGALALSVGASASEADARDVFALAGAGGMTFSGLRVVEDVSMVFLHFTPEGRLSLIGELERTGVLTEAVGRRVSLRGDLQPTTVHVRRRVGGDGLDEYELNGDMRLQWSRCSEDGRCVPTGGGSKKVKVSGVVVQAVINGRPAHRVSAIRYEGGR